MKEMKKVNFEIRIITNCNKKPKYITLNELRVKYLNNKYDLIMKPRR